MLERCLTPSQPESPLRLLIVEDAIEDAELIAIALDTAGIPFNYDIADTSEACEQFLARHRYDAVLSDYRLPSFNGFRALELLRRSQQDIPFILVTGTLGEEAAVECIKAGMTDYVLKDRLFRLPIVLARSLEEFELRRQKQEAIARVQASAQREAIINRIVQAMRETLVLDDVLQTTVDRLHEALDVSRSWIAQLDPDRGAIVRCVSRTTADAERFLDRSCECYRHYEPILARGEIAIASRDDAELPPTLRQHMETQGTRALLIVPLIYQHAHLGGITLQQCDRPRQWSEGDLSLVRAIADRAAIAIHQAQLYQTAQTELAERQRAEEALRESQQHLATMAANIPGSVYRAVFHADGRISLPYISAGVIETTGMDRDEAMSDPARLIDTVHAEDRADFDRHLQRGIHTLQPCHREYRVIIATSGEVKWLRDSSRFSRQENGDIVIDGVSLDITDRKRAEVALRQSEQRFRALIENATDITMILDADGTIRYVSPSVERILGYAPDRVAGRRSFDYVHPDECRSVRRILDCAIANPNVSQPPIEYRVRHARGTWCVLEAVATNLLDLPAVGGIVVNCHDVSDRKQAEHQLRHDALHDALTGLPNRTLFSDRLEHALIRARGRKANLFALLFLDLDRFKTINDSLGHGAGDRLLVAIAQRLNEQLRPGDTLARLGGDEFAILIEDISSMEEAKQVARAIEATLKPPLLLENRRVFVSASIGIALGSNRYDRADRLLRDGEIAMYRAKDRGKARHEMFDPDLHRLTMTRLQLETDLPGAIERGEFVVYYQPIVELATGNLHGFEALVRWQHPQRGLISPGQFIPIAEETGAIVLLEDRVLRQACWQLRCWHRKFPQFAHLTVSANLSGRQFSQADLIDRVDRILRDTGLPGRYLKLEITESVLIENADTATDMLRQLRDRDIQTCIDDFGTGYSSLSYLHHFPTNMLKIDRSFVSMLAADGKNSEIVRAIVNLSRDLGLEVTAEGVELEYQRSQLAQLQCHYGQGYLFAKPGDARAAEASIRKDGIDRISLSDPTAQTDDLPRQDSKLSLSENSWSL